MCTLPHPACGTQLGSLLRPGFITRHAAVLVLTRLLLLLPTLLHCPLFGLLLLFFTPVLQRCRLSEKSSFDHK